MLYCIFLMYSLNKSEHAGCQTSLSTHSVHLLGWHMGVLLRKSLVLNFRGIPIVLPRTRLELHWTHFGRPSFNLKQLA